MAADRFLKLAVTATAAGAFSGLFGVGGGTVIVPLLIFLFAALLAVVAIQFLIA